MQVRNIATAANGLLVLALYLTVWGAPSLTIALVEIVLAAGAAAATWYVLKMPLRGCGSRASTNRRSRQSGASKHEPTPGCARSPGG